MPNSSGAPVCYDSRTLAGIHLGTIYHLDSTYADSEQLKEVSATLTLLHDC
jgi:hypothetical protein